MFVVTVSACPERSNNGKQRKIHHPLWPTEPGGHTENEQDG